MPRACPPNRGVQQEESRQHSQCSTMEQTLSADLEHGRGDDSALRSGSAGAEGYLGHHPTARQSSFAAQSQKKVSEDEFRQILDLTPLFVTVLDQSQ